MTVILNKRGNACPLCVPTTLTAKTVIRHTFPAFLLAFALDSGNKWKYQARLEEWKRVANSRQTSETAKKEVENTTESDTIKLDNLEVRKRYLEKVSEIKDKQLPKQMQM